ncbi:MAG: prepilin-type N-terminal cleavage/methylation domain-containing protein [Bacteroidota bacterium]
MHARETARPTQRVPATAPAPSGGDAGFTLAETLIAMTLLVLLAGFAFSAYALASRALTRWDRRTDLEDAAHVVRQRLALDLLSASRVRVTPDSLIIWGEGVASGGLSSNDLASGGAGTPVTYAVRDSALYRGEVQAHRDAVRLGAFDTWAVTARGDSASSGDTEDGDLALVGARVVLALDTARVERVARVAVRRMPAWTPAR